MKLSLLKLSYKFLLLSLSVLFIFAGINKILHTPIQLQQFDTLGIPIPVMVVIGFTEVCFGILLHVRYFTKIALTGLLFIMTCALLFTAMTQTLHSCILPLIISIIIMVTIELGQKILNRRHNDHHRS